MKGMLLRSHNLSLARLKLWLACNASKLDLEPELSVATVKSLRAF